MSLNKDFLVEIAPPKLAESVLNLDDDLIDMDIAELEKRYKFSKTDRILRKKFQDEYNRAIMKDSQFVVANVFRNVVHENTWRTRVITNEYRMAYMMQPIKEVEDELKVLEEDFINGLTDIAKAGPFSKKIRVSDYLAAAKVVLSRTAPPVQRQEIKQMSIKANIGQENISNDQLEEKIKGFIEDRTKIVEVNETGKDSTSEKAGRGKD